MIDQEFHKVLFGKYEIADPKRREITSGKSEINDHETHKIHEISDGK
jgi:hypothetical protein